jgi:hypothetical protein
MIVDPLHPAGRRLAALSLQLHFAPAPGRPRAARLTVFSAKVHVHRAAMRTPSPRQ